MAQQLPTDYPIDPTVTSGTALADILNRSDEVFNSTNSGPTRPATIKTGGLWAKTGGAALELFMFDGTTDIPIQSGDFGVSTDEGNITTLGTDGLVMTDGTALDSKYVEIAGDTMTGALAVNSDLSYTGTLTGGTGVINIGLGQVFKDASGNLLVGTTSSAGLGTFTQAFVGFGVSQANFMHISRNNPDVKLLIQDSINRNGTYIDFGSGTIQTGSIVTDGTSTSYVTSSDYRLKENLVPISDALTRILAVPVYRYNFIADPAKTVDGFIAHELAEHLPEAVTGKKDGIAVIGNVVDVEGKVLQEGVNNPGELQRNETFVPTGERPVHQGVDQSKITPLLTAAIQELSAKLDALQAEVDALKGSTP